MAYTISYETMFETMDYVDNAIIVENITTYEILNINKEAKKLLKINKSGDITRLKQLISSETVYKELEKGLLSDLKNHKKSEGIAYLKCLDNTFLEVNFICNWLFEENGIICYTFKKAVEVIAEKSITFKQVAEQLPSGIIVMDIEHELSIAYANNEHYKILGVDDSLEKNGKYLLKDFIYEEDTHWVLAEIYTHLTNHQDVDIEFRMKASDNVVKWVRLYGRSSVSEKGEKLFYSSIKDLSERRSFDDKLHMQRVLFHKITELTEDIIFRLDLQTNIIHFLGKTDGIFAEKTVFKNYPDSLLEYLKIHKDDLLVHEDLVNCFKNGIEKPLEIRYKVSKDSFEWYRITYNFVKNNDKTPISVIGKMSNINAQKLLEERAKTDLLTGFYNKVTTQQEINKLISYKNENSLAFFIIDIDNFKAINDNLGHHFGDLVLTEISDDIRECFRQDDVLGRIGGDEFVVAMRDAGNTSVIVEKAEKLCEVLSKTYTGGTNCKYSISASIGISMYPSDGDSFEKLYKKSDIALYEIKKTTKNGYKQYFDDLERKNIAHVHKKHEDKRRTSVLINNTVITAVLNLMYESKSFEMTMSLVFEYIGKMFNLDKCYIFETSKQETSYVNNYSWSVVRREKCNITENIKKSNISVVLNCVDDDGVFYTNDIDTIYDEWTVKSLKNDDVKSMFLVDSLDQFDEKFIFFIEDCKSKRVWSEEEVVTLLHISKLIFTALNNHHKDEQLKLLKNKVNNVSVDLTDKKYDKYALEQSGEIADFVCSFYGAKNIKTSVSKMIKNIVDLLSLSRVRSIVYDEHEDKYSTSFEYEQNGEFFNFPPKFKSEYSAYINTMSHIENEDREEFFSLINDKNYLYCDNYSEIKETLNKVGFIPKNEDELTEIYVFAARKKSFFSYLAFESYTKDKMPNAKINILTALCKILNAEIEKFDLIQKYEDDILMKDAILKNEKTPMALIEKDTYKVIYHNELYFNVLPNIEIGGTCYKFLGKNKKCKECCIDNDVLLNDSNHSDHQWIKKAIPFTLNNGKEVYMIYAKDSIDYVNQINAVDNLTQALLLRGFEEYYKNVIKKNNNKYALCTLDIDKFKYINEMFDHKTGDIILRKIADVIRDFINAEENFCRISGDRFSLFIVYDDEVELNRKVRQLSKNLDAMKSENFQDIKITVIAGVTFVDKSLDINVILGQAELARKNAKGSHKNTFEYYNPQFDLNIKREIKLEEQLPYALANDEFVPFLQPKFDLNTNKICGAEALVRWISRNGIIYPNEFIPLFERNGFILTLDFIIYDKIMAHIRDCLDTGLPVYPISVNVSRNHVQDKDFLEKFMELIKKYEVPHKYLELEITESTFVENKKALSDFVDGIKNCDLKVSIDDFGTAYSSLQSLTGIDVDVLKIDKGFLDNIDISKDNVTRDELLMKNIINMAQDLEFNVVCEGIESEEQVELLKKIACKYGQGYVFAKPMPIAEYKKRFLEN